MTYETKRLPGTINKAYKYQLRPNKEQRGLLAKAFGCARFVYNYFLALAIDTYKRTKKGLSYEDQAKLLVALKKNPEYEWLKEVPSQTLQQSLINLRTAYTNFFKKRAKFPKFKKKHNKQSIRFPQGFKVDGDFVYLPKIGWVRVNFHRHIKWQIKSLTVQKTKTGEYFISFVCEVKDLKPEYCGGEIGIDVGLKIFAVTSDGEFFDKPRYLKKAETSLVYWQRRMSRRQRGSSGYEKARVKVAKMHKKVANQRSDYQHKLSRYLVENYSAIYLEDLNVKGMLKNHKLAKSISDAAWGQFTRYLAYKGEWYGCWVEKIDRFVPSSKLCSMCGFKNDELTLNDRNWVCPKCGTNHDRDFNAAVNILAFARAGTALDNAGGVGVSLANSGLSAMKPEAPCFS